MLSVDELFLAGDHAVLVADWVGVDTPKALLLALLVQEPLEDPQQALALGLVAVAAVLVEASEAVVVALEEIAEASVAVAAGAVLAVLAVALAAADLV